jgi:monoamine oxidase
VRGGRPQPLRTDVDAARPERAYLAGAFMSARKRTSTGGRPESWDVVIIGAGAAGLTAARGLAARGRRVLVLEARDRVGGRIDPRIEPGWPAGFEAGAEFVHGRAPAIERLVRLGRWRLREVEERHWQGDGRRLVRIDGRWKAALALLEELPQAGRDRTFDELAAAAGWRRRAGPDVRGLLRTYVEGFNAAPADRIGLQGLRLQTRAASAIDGDRLFRLPGGYGPLVDLLARRARRAGAVFRMGTEARGVRWRRGRAIVETRALLGARSSRLATRAVVVTVPLGVLRASVGAGRLRFDPPLPRDKRRAIRALGVGQVVRALLRFRQPLQARGAQDLTFLHVPGAAFPTFWRAADGEDRVLVAWAGGPAARDLEGRPTGETARAALRSLARGLSRDAATLAAELEAFRVFDWQADPHARGAYSFIPVGALDAVARLAAPLADTVFFAGEATHTAGATGTVHGALDTGERVVREILGRG